MPSNTLPLRVSHFLLRACPYAVLATHDIVREAVNMDLRDDDVIIRLMEEYNADEQGRPKGPLPKSRSAWGDDISCIPPIRYAMESSRNASGRGKRGTGFPTLDDSSAVLQSREMNHPAWMSRRRLIENFYIVNRIAFDACRVDLVVKESIVGAISDAELLLGLMTKYGRNEIGEPYPISELQGRHVQREENNYGVLDSQSDIMPRTPHEIDTILKSLSLKHKLNVMFRAAAPKRSTEIKGISDSFLSFNGKVSAEDILFSASRSLNRCATDGWPLDPEKRRLARVHHFFTNNDIFRLSCNQAEISSIVNSTSSDHALFLELYYCYGKNELGEDLYDEYSTSTAVSNDGMLQMVPLPCYISNNLRARVTNFLSRACPLAATEDLVFEFLAYHQRKGMSSHDELISVMMDQFDCGEGGWPNDNDRRVRNKVTRYLMRLAPQDLKHIDEIIGECSSGFLVTTSSTSRSGVKHIGHTHEDIIMKRLYEKYGFTEDGRPFLNTPAVRNCVCEFLEQYLPDKKIEAAVEQAVRMEMSADTLMAVLRKQYSNMKPYPNPLREQLRNIYRRAAPSRMNQIHHLMRVKRVENISEKVILRIVCQKLNVGSDGWPKDPVKRRRHRLTLFFQHNDPSRLDQIELLMDRDKRSDEEIFNELETQYGRNEVGDVVAPTPIIGTRPFDISTPKTGIYYTGSYPGLSIAELADGYVSPPAIGPADSIEDTSKYTQLQHDLKSNLEEKGAPLNGSMSMKQLSSTGAGDGSNFDIDAAKKRDEMALQSSNDISEYFESMRHRYLWVKRLYS